jgi:two-component system sensor histidine kinase BaeS
MALIDMAAQHSLRRERSREERLEGMQKIRREAQLRRLLLTLIDNALKYTLPGGRVTIEGVTGPADVTISVADAGPGVSPEDLPHVLERFWRADRVQSRETGGTGLGLTIAKQIAELHGAHLGVQREVGRESVFTIRLPAASDRPTSASVEASRRGDSGASTACGTPASGS